MKQNTLLTHNLDAIKRLVANGNSISKSTVFVFDMDGTLIDTDESNFNSYKDAVWDVLSRNLEYVSDVRFNRKTLREAIPDINERDIDLIVDRKEQIFSKHISETRLNNTLVEIADAVHYNFKTVLLTDSRKRRAESLLKCYDLDSLFSEKYYKEDFGGADKYTFFFSQNRLGDCPMVFFENEADNLEQLRSMKNGNQCVVPVTCW